MKLIIDIDKDRYDKNYLLVKNGMGDDVHRAVANGTPILDNATNGDMLKIMFPNIENQMIDLVMRCGTSIKRIENDTWMNLPYQKGGKE